MVVLVAEDPVVVPAAAATAVVEVAARGEVVVGVGEIRAFVTLSR